MKILFPHKISGALLDVIHEAQQELVLVSPYVNLTHWKQLAAALTAARDRGVRITFYTRHEPSNLASKEQVEALGITPQLVAHLHAKFYFNETTGIITSLNLLGSSNSNSIEIGSQLETAAELAELRHFVQQYIVPQQFREEDAYLNTEEFDQILLGFLEEFVDDCCQVTLKADGILTIRALRNSFTIALAGPTHQLVLEGVVSGREANRYDAQHARHFTAATLRYELQRGHEKQYDVVRATLPQALSASTFSKLAPAEKKQLCTLTADFITAVRAFKDSH